MNVVKRPIADLTAMNQLVLPLPVPSVWEQVKHFA
jgi:hypothetical protein